MTPPAGDGVTQPGRILVVDDTAFNRQLLAKLLRGIGHEPEEAQDGSVALERLRDPGRPPFHRQRKTARTAGVRSPECGSRRVRPDCVQGTHRSSAEAAR